MVKETSHLGSAGAAVQNSSAERTELVWTGL